MLSESSSRDNFLSFFEERFTKHLQTHYSLGSHLDGPIHYALNGKGKRVRPLLAFLVNDCLGGDKEAALFPAMAVEMIHTYSLVHDDMPILDDDAYRRGRKTVHVVYDEETALLTGNAILTDSFSLLSSENSFLSQDQKIKMISELSLAAGSKGMLIGQMLDLFWTKKQGFTELDLNTIHLNKTGKLLGTSCALGALSSNNASVTTVQNFKKIGELIGLSFQIIDDLLDESSLTGKSSGKDLEQGKLTYLRVYSPEKCL